MSSKKVLIAFFMASLSCWQDAVLQKIDSKMMAADFMYLQLFSKD